MRNRPLPLLILLAAFLAGCHSNGPIAPGGGNAPPEWINSAGVISVVPGDSVVTVYWGEAIDWQDPPVTYLVYKDVDDTPFDQPPVQRKNNDPYTFTGLENGVTYWFGVRCEDSARHIDDNDKVLSAMPRSGDITPPVWDTTIGVVSVALLDSEVTVHWGTATDKQSSPVQYLIYKDTDNNPWDQQPVVRPTNDPYTFQNLQGGTEYWFGVRCRDSAAPPNMDENAKVVSSIPDTAPPAWDSTVGVVSVVPGDQEVTVYWGKATDALSPPVEYLVYKDTDINPFDMEAVIRTNNDPYTFSTLQNGENYWFGVRCRDSALPLNTDKNAVVLSAQPYARGWARTWGGTGEDYGNSVAVDSSGNTYVTGYFYGTLDCDPGPGIDNHTAYGVEDAFLSKFDSAGNFLWARTWGGTNPDVSGGDLIEGQLIALDEFGYVYVTGAFVGTVDFDPGAGVANHVSSTDSGCAYLSKFDTSGSFVWTRTWGETGGADGCSVAVDSSGMVYITGDFWGTVDFDPGAGVDSATAGGEDVFLSKFDLDGNFVWARIWGSAQSYDGDTDEGHSVAVDFSGNVFVTGSFQNTVDFDPGPGVDTHESTWGQSWQGWYYCTPDIFLSKFDSSGNFNWVQTWGGGGIDEGASVVVDGSGNAYVAGDYDISAFLGKVDPAGGIIWTRTWGEEGYLGSGSSAAVDGSGNVYLSGYSVGSVGGFLTKLDSNGKLIWAIEDQPLFYFSLATDGSGKVYATGCFSGTGDFDPGPGVDIHSSPYHPDWKAYANCAFLAKYPPGGYW